MVHEELKGTQAVTMGHANVTITPSKNTHGRNSKIIIICLNNKNNAELQFRQTTSLQEPLKTKSSPSVLSVF